MFRCTECSEEYKIKPDYCKCGNDEFEEITEIQDKTISKEDTQISEKTESKIPLKLVFQISYIIFCIILAIIPWLFKTENASKTTEQPKEKISQTIPELDTFWNDKPDIRPQEIKAEKIQDNTQTTANIQSPPLQTTSSKNQKPAQTAQKTQTSKDSKPKATPSAPKNSQKQPAKTESNRQTAKVEKPKLPQSVLNPQPQAKPTPKPKPEPPKMNSQEFLKYKGEIRSALLSKLNITAIQGTGDCAVEFSLDNSGKLINRNFIYKSSNKTLNDEVYLMLMRLPYFKQPPQYYRGEKIRLKFYINNGYYEITFL